MGRRASREIAMKLLYQMDIQKDDRQQQIDQTLGNEELSGSDRIYIKEIVEGVQLYQDKIDSLIESHSKGWKLNRISKVDLAILRLSTFEILYRNDIPLNVSINEAVELAKKFSSDESGSFVNGILGKIQNLKKDSL